MEEYRRLRMPLTADDARSLRAGEMVLLDGEVVITAGLPTHKRMLDCLDTGEALPVDLAGVLLHLGGYSQLKDGAYECIYINPTTSTRFNAYMPRLIRELGLHAVGGKGGLDRESARAMQETGCVYLSFIGGGCTVLSRAIREVVAVGWQDMLIHYRLVKLRVEGLGPCTVGIDAHGSSLYDHGVDEAARRLPDIMRGLNESRRRFTADS